LGSKVTLKDGSVTTVDTDYLIRAVREPNAQRRDDATGQMPTFDEDRLSDEQLAQVVAYITDLSAK
jgi:mono/diheme cytochrome c family protein